MVTALLEYLDLLAVFPEAYVDLILFVIILVEGSVKFRDWKLIVQWCGYMLVVFA